MPEPSILLILALGMFGLAFSKIKLTTQNPFKVMRG
ncbi:MAG: PEP-CTERM sorting domain-containing protein [Alteromonadaceae bacterium]|nr:PEP-CTERM sorting domain-containing protein [Alteromonadaceae bacterium]